MKIEIENHANVSDWCSFTPYFVMHVLARFEISIVLTDDECEPVSSFYLPSDASSNSSLFQIDIFIK